MAMTADVSRALATFISSQGLGQDTARALADQYSDVTTVDALPEWLTEQDADEGSATRSHLHILDNGICTTCEVARSFNPSEPRIPGGPHGGEWGHGGIGKDVKKALAGQDPLKLADRIDLPAGDHLVSTGSVNDLVGDKSAVVAHINGNGGPRVRLGLVLPEDKRKWRAADKGATVDLDQHQAEAVRTELKRLQTKGPELLKQYRHGVNDGTYTHPEDLAALSGKIPASWGDLAWQLSLEEGGSEIKGPDVGHGDSYDAGRWYLSLNVAPKGSNGGAHDSEMDPMHLEKTSQIGKLIDLLQPAGA